MKNSIQQTILLSLALIWLAQLAFIPVYLSAVFLCMMLSLFWHFKVSLKQSEHIHPKILTAIWVLIALGMIYASFQSFLGVEAGTAFLATFLYAKALETKSKRDLIILFNFALFVSASLFLHSQSIWMTLVVIGCLLSCLLGLYRVQTTEFKPNQDSKIQAIKTDIQHVAKFVALAIPFFIILFMFFPRFPPLWQIPISNQQGVTGISDQMSPGDIAELSQSSALAFRVLMDLTKLPPQHELYWRAMVLDRYDGTTWTRHDLNQNVIQQHTEKLKAQGTEYQYLAADIRQKWVTALEYSLPNERRFSVHQDYSITPNRMVQRNQPIALLWMGQNFRDEHVQLSFLQKKTVLDYPLHKDLKAQQFAQKMFRDSGSKPEVYLHKVLKWYQQQKFSYTLKPGLLGEHRVDEFLFKTRQGFCEHYASSFVMLMRYVGIPARVVVGYQGGQSAPDGQSWEVRQLDAHAWSEVLIDGQWQRVDPTAVIAPQRIDLGMQNYLSNDRSIFGDQQFSGLRYQQFSMLKQLRVWSDYASFQWQNKVVGYDADQQKQWLRILGLKSHYALGIALIFMIMALGLFYFMLSKFKLFSRQAKHVQLIDSFNKKMTKDLQKRSEESFQMWIERIAKHANDFQSFHDLIQIHRKIVYLNQSDKFVLIRFKKLLKECATELKAGKSTCQDSEK